MADSQGLVIKRGGEYFVLNDEQRTQRQGLGDAPPTVTVHDVIEYNGEVIVYGETPDYVQHTDLHGVEVIRIRPVCFVMLTSRNQNDARALSEIAQSGGTPLYWYISDRFDSSQYWRIKRASKRIVTWNTGLLGPPLKMDAETRKYDLDSASKEQWIEAGKLVIQLYHSLNETGELPRWFNVRLERFRDEQAYRQDGRLLQ